MKLKFLCAAGVLLSASAFAQGQSGSDLRSAPAPGIPSTGTSGDMAGSGGTTAPRSSSAPDTSVGASGATSPSAPNRASGRCDTLTGEERLKCQREQASGGSTGARSTGAGSTGAASGATPGARP